MRRYPMGVSWAGPTRRQARYCSSRSSSLVMVLNSSTRWPAARGAHTRRLQRGRPAVLLPRSSKREGTGAAQQGGDGPSCRRGVRGRQQHGVPSRGGSGASAPTVGTALLPRERGACTGCRASPGDRHVPYQAAGEPWLRLPTRGVQLDEQAVQQRKLAAAAHEQRRVEVVRQRVGEAGVVAHLRACARGPSGTQPTPAELADGKMVSYDQGR